MELAAVIKEMPVTEKWLTVFMIVITGLISPVLSLLLTVGFLVWTDCLLGVWASMKRGDKFSSSRFRHSVSKMFVYHLVLVLGYFVEKHMLFETVPLTKVAATMIGLAEMISVYENSSSIIGKPIFSGILSILNKK